jgi:glycosyltransferase involved in cell wall biosynthesis
MKERSFISIAMCTYNGAHFLREQLYSFLRQTLLPDELVICDDHSQDNTIDIIKEFTSQASFPVHLFINNKNIGFAKNFEKAVLLCSGDIIFFSDQDDVWLSDKIEKIYKVFLNNIEIGFVFSDAFIVNANLHNLRYSLWDIYSINKNRSNIYLRHQFTPFFFIHTAIAGCTTAIRSNLCKRLLPLPDSWAHDEWFPFAASITMGVASLCDKLIKFRQHPDQLYGNKKPRFLKKLLDYLRQPDYSHELSYIKRKLMWTEAFIRISNEKYLYNIGVLEDIKSYLHHIGIRHNLSSCRIKRIPIILKELLAGNYHFYSNGWMSLLKDLYINKNLA